MCTFQHVRSSEPPKDGRPYVLRRPLATLFQTKSCRCADALASAHDGGPASGSSRDGDGCRLIGRTRWGGGLDDVVLRASSQAFSRGLDTLRPRCPADRGPLCAHADPLGSVPRRHARGRLPRPAAAFLDPGDLATSAVWLVERYRWRALVINLAARRRRPSSPPSPSRRSTRRPTGSGSSSLLALVAGGDDGGQLRSSRSPLFALLDGQPVRAHDARRRWRCSRPCCSTSALVAVIAGDLRRARPARARLRAAQRDRLHVHGAARARRARAHAPVREPLVGRPLGPDPHARRARLARGAPLRRRRRASRATSPSTRGMSKRDQELAHTAGLLHDIGKFALSDRVMERGGQLTDADWRGIRRHPEIGADLLRDIGVYGPVAEIVRAHHERLDGRGYPRRLKGDEIPAIARDRRRRRGLRHAHRARHLPHADELLRGAQRAAPRRGLAARRRLRRGARRPARRAAAPTTATPTRPTSTASSTSSGG